MAIVRHIKTNTLYRYLGSDRYKNIYTGAEGIIAPEKAKQIFVINIELTQILSDYPLIEEMIFRLKMVAEK
jgi:hypothetical protein